MAKKRIARSEKKMKPLYLVFCEGETEENYINFLKNEYRNPVKVISKIVGQNISQKLIARYEKAEHISKSDNITSFIMYDLDTIAIIKKIQACKAIHLFSNPCIELWFLLHLRDQKASITTAESESELKRFNDVWKNYSKGSLSDRQKKILWDNRKEACERVKSLKENENPSSTVYRFIEVLEKSNCKGFGE